MKTLRILLLSLGGLVYGQNIQSIQLFNPQTNDETPVIKMGEQLVLSFDDLTNGSEIYRYTIKHYDRNWNDDNLFFTEFATGNKNALLDQFQYSFNTLQAYTHYKLVFPNDKIQPKISGNYELIVYKDSVEKPLFKRRFYLVENAASLALNISRFADAKKPDLNQRVEVKAVSAGGDLSSNVNSMSLYVMQNNNPNMIIPNQKPSATLGNQLLFQQMNLVFPGDNEFYYFDNKNMNMAADMVRATELKDDVNQTYLHPVWAFPLNYQYQPDVNGAWYYRRNDLGRERDAEREADYAWVHFYLESDPVDKEIYVLGGFNNFKPSKENQMQYDPATKQYVGRIYLKQGFYNYVLATKQGDGPLNFGEVNGNFWQTENLYQAFLYYAPFGRNYDGLMGYGEFRTPISK
ncbi:type IX secretion system plug protein [Chryseobacterium pennipullorum]|uniref:DUF5103 domain-containing protein n=1 Tax=Chryseobacterium pennipullorum TaxID=2258963 RepID=A0A3D9B2V8_9FLAO|nr:type IX secretion system plug protein domain-containing protein [Chryseobacterium pennipullorum]REC47965.1 DUF5103 domain-containing protein [Chryseobacterium pennipullorum]